MEEKEINLSLTKEELKKVLRLLELDEDKKQEEKQVEEEKKNVNFIQIYRDNMPELR